MGKRLQHRELQILASIGWPVVKTDEELEKIFASVGWPVLPNAEPSEKTITASWPCSQDARLTVPSAATGRNLGVSDYIYHLNHMAADTYDAIKCSKRGNWHCFNKRDSMSDQPFLYPAADICDAINCPARDKWIGKNSRHSKDKKTFLWRLTMACCIGFTPANAYAVGFCLVTGEPFHQWVCSLQIKPSKGDAMPVQGKKRLGRPSRPSPPKVLEDLEIFLQVDFWRHQICGIYRSGRPRYVSPDMAFRIVRAMRFPQKDFRDGDDHIDAFKKADARTVERFKKLVKILQDR